ncbi:MAG: RNA-binding protein [Candidatus Thermoplasmatota archaeon]
MVVKIKNRHILDNKSIEVVDNKLAEDFSTSFLKNSSSKIEQGIVGGKNFIIVDDEPCFVQINDEFFFTLFGINKFQPSKNYVVVDMGAVRFVSDGATVMAPGIVDANENIEKGFQVWVCDEKYKKPLAVGIALINWKDMINKSEGKAVQTVHHVGDKYWDMFAKGL